MILFPLPDFKPWGSGYESVYYGLWDSTPTYSRKEHIELYNILKFGVNQANIRRDTAIQKLKNFLRIRRSIHFLVKFGVFEWLYLS